MAADTDAPDETSNSSHHPWRNILRGAVVLGVVAVAAAVVAKAITSNEPDQPDLPRPGTETGSGEAGPSRFPARVLLAIDVSESMDCPLEYETKECEQFLRARPPLPPSVITRIQAAREWSRLPVGDLNLRDDEVGLWSFTTSVTKQYPEHQRRLRELSPATKSHRRLIVKDVERLVASGGTPLDETIVAGIEELQEAGPTKAIKSLVILTDGLENAPQVDAAAVQRRLNAAVDETKSNPVRVIITAAADAQCTSLRKVVDLFRGDCIRVKTEDRLPDARRKIRTLLRTPMGSG